MSGEIAACLGKANETTEKSEEKGMDGGFSKELEGDATRVQMIPTLAVVRVLH